MARYRAMAALERWSEAAARGSARRSPRAWRLWAKSHPPSSSSSSTSTELRRRLRRQDRPGSVGPTKILWQQSPRTTSHHRSSKSPKPGRSKRQRPPHRFKPARQKRVLQQRCFLHLRRSLDPEPPQIPDPNPNLDPGTRTPITPTTSLPWWRRTFAANSSKSRNSDGINQNQGRDHTHFPAPSTISIMTLSTTDTTHAPTTKCNPHVHTTQQPPQRLAQPKHPYQRRRRPPLLLLLFLLRLHLHLHLHLRLRHHCLPLGRLPRRAS